MARQARLDSPGTLHHVMVREIERRRIVDNEQDRKEFVTRLGTVAIETATSSMPGRYCQTMPTFYYAVECKDCPCSCDGY